MTEVERSGALIGVDGSPAGLSALRWAAARVGQVGPLRPAYVWKRPATPNMSGPAPTGGAPPAEAMQLAGQKAAEAFLDVVPGTDYETPIVLMGDPEDVLLTLSKTAEMIVVGCRHQSHIARWVLGSTSRHLVSHADVPVVVVPERAEQGDTDDPRRILVGIDGSEHASSGMRWAVDHARPGDDITAICCWSIPAGIGYDVPQFDREQLRAAAIQTVHETVAAAVGHDSDRVECRVAEGDPRSVISAEARNYDLLVLGSRGRSGLAHLFAGSTTTALTFHPEIPTVVVP